MSQIPYIDKSFIEQETVFADLIAELKARFAADDTIVPMRHHHEFPHPVSEKDTTMLLMPAWNPNAQAGVKIITVTPENMLSNLPSIQGMYVYIDTQTGIPKAIIEATSLTAKRTAAASALASTYLSRQDATSLLMIGTGALSSNLILAHATVRPIDKVYIWGRNYQKAQAVADNLKDRINVIPIKTKEEKISEVDIISCATLSESPLVKGRLLKPGQHIDLVGAYKISMRESDDEAMIKSRIFVDTLEAGLKESGDIVQPLQRGIITEQDIQSDLFALCKEDHLGRQNWDEITLFKSVGHALEDLAAADYYYNRFKRKD